MFVREGSRYLVKGRSKNVRLKVGFGFLMSLGCWLVLGWKEVMCFCFVCSLDVIFGS